MQDVAPQSEKLPYHLVLSFKTVFNNLTTVALAVSLTANLLLLYVLIFRASTTFAVFFESNTPLYIGLSIVLSGIASLLAGLALTQTLYIVNQRLVLRRGQGAGRGIFGIGLGALAASCPVCGSALLPALGIAGSLAAFPLQGLEIKLLAVVILTDALWENSRTIAGICRLSAAGRLLDFRPDAIVFKLNSQAFARLRPALIVGFATLAVYLLPALPPQYRVNFAARASAAPAAIAAPIQTGSDSPDDLDRTSLVNQVLPPDGYEINAIYGDTGPQLLEVGAIDFERFAALYEQNGAPLTDQQRAILQQGLDEPITITRDNAYFLLNFFWAFGLTNNNLILDDGPLTQYGEGQIGRFASTGGWTLGTKPATELYSQYPIVMLASAQQERLEEVANNAFRPCCNNSTAFADCNHGMALLGLLEIMAAQDATMEEMFDAAKYFNAFWFPQQSLDLAVYFEAREGLSFAEVDARRLVSADYSSAGGWTQVRQWLASNNLIEQTPSGGGSCGV